MGRVSPLIGGSYPEAHFYAGASVSYLAIYAPATSARGHIRTLESPEKFGQNCVCPRVPEIAVAD